MKGVPASGPSGRVRGSSGSSVVSRPRLRSSSSSCSVRRAVLACITSSSHGVICARTARSFAALGAAKRWCRTVPPGVPSNSVVTRKRIGPDGRRDGVAVGEVVIWTPVEQLLDAGVLAVHAVVGRSHPSAVAHRVHLHTRHTQLPVDPSTRCGDELPSDLRRGRGRACRSSRPPDARRR